MSAALIGTAGCSKQPAAPAAVTSPATVATTNQAETTNEKKIIKEKSEREEKKENESINWLARLDAIKNRVESRQRNESIWKPSVLGMAFERFDALQTQSQSSAKIVYQSGSKLDVGDNTLLIFDHDPGKKKRKEDRVIVKNGELTGSTKTELWVFTNAGLVQIKAEASTRIAKAKISVQGDQKIKVKVDTGTAEVLFKGKEAYEKLHVAAKSDVEVVSSVKLVDSNNQVAAERLEEMSTAAEKPVKIVKAELSVDQPVDGSVTTEPEIEAKGRLSAAGGKLLINGELTELREDFSFAKKIKLQPGSNLIVFQVVRSDGTVQFMRRSLRLQAGL